MAIQLLGVLKGLQNLYFDFVIIFYDQILRKERSTPQGCHQKEGTHLSVSKSNFNIKYLVHQHQKMRTLILPDLDMITTLEQDLFLQTFDGPTHFEFSLYVGYHDLLVVDDNPLVVGNPTKKMHVKLIPKPCKNQLLQTNEFSYCYLQLPQ